MRSYDHAEKTSPNISKASTGIINSRRSTGLSAHQNGPSLQRSPTDSMLPSQGRRTTGTSAHKNGRPLQRSPTDSMLPSQGRTGTHQSNAIRSTTKKALRRRNTNYGSAPKLEIWQVARACTAAQFYFDPLIVKNGDLDTLFTDGGFGPRTNPTQEGIDDIYEQFSQDSGDVLSVVVSVGTAKKDKTPKNSLKSDALALIDVSSNPDTIHHAIENQPDKSFSYFRLDDREDENGGLDMEFDDWSPRTQRKYRKAEPGSKTLEYIDIAWRKWASETQNINKLRACAKSLVKLRRIRARDEDRWERFATCAEFRCRQRGCPSNDVIYSRKAFRDHVEHEHEHNLDAMDDEIEACRTEWRYPPRQTERHV